MLSSIMAFNTSSWVGSERKPHLDPEVLEKYIIALGKLVYDE